MAENEFVAGAVTTDTDTVIVTVDENGYIDVYGPYSYWTAWDLKGQIEVEFDGSIELRRLGVNYSSPEE